MGRQLAFDAGRGISPLEVQVPELIDWLEGKEPTAINNWNELGAEEYARAFTAARTAGYNIVKDLYQGFLAVMREPGATSADFVARMLPILRQKGWLTDETTAKQASRLLLIFETNLRTAQAVGQWERIQRTKAALPYLMGRTAHDVRVRHPPKSPVSDHRAFEGILLPVDHPFWKDYFPPLGFRCRCQVVQLTRSQVAKRGLAVTSPVELSDRRARLGKPWGFNPGTRPMQQSEEAVRRANEERLDGAPFLDLQQIIQDAQASFVQAAKREFRSPVRADVTAATIKVEKKTAVARRLNAEFKEAAADARYSPIPEFSGRGAADWGVAKFSAAYKDETASMLAALKPELDDLATQLGIPPIRGFKSLAVNSRSNANQGDGVMGINPNAFNARAAQVGAPQVSAEAVAAARQEINRDLDALNAQLDQVYDDLARLAREHPDIPTIRLRPGATEVLARRAEIFAKIEERQQAAYALNRQSLTPKPASTWKPGDAVANRPWTVSDYQVDGVDKARSTLFHEFAHHVHQYLNKTGHRRLVGNPPLERELEGIFREAMAKRKGRMPSTYSEANSKEWFAENFSAFVMGRRDLVDPDAVALIERLFRGDFR
jgi:hypothetical protein